MSNTKKSEALKRVEAVRAQLKADEEATIAAAQPKPVDWFEWVQKSIGLVLSLWAIVGIAIWAFETQDRENDRAARRADLISRAEKVIETASADGKFTMKDTQAAWAIETLVGFGQHIRIKVEDEIELKGMRLDCSTLELEAPFVYFDDVVLRSSEVQISTARFVIDRGAAADVDIYMTASGDRFSVVITRAALRYLNLWIGMPDAAGQTTTSAPAISGAVSLLHTTGRKIALGARDRTYLYEWVGTDYDGQMPSALCEPRFGSELVADSGDGRVGVNCSGLGAEPAKQIRLWRDGEPRGPIVADKRCKGEPKGDMARFWFD